MDNKIVRIIFLSFLIILGSFALMAVLTRSKEEIWFLTLTFCLFILIMLIVAIRKRKRVSFKIGSLFALAHWLFFVYVLFYGEWDKPLPEPILFYILDIFLIPIFILFRIFLDDVYLLYLIVFGITGTACWFFIPIGIARIVKRFTRPKVKALFSPA